MTEPHEPDLDALDRAAHNASRGLHAHVDGRIDPELMLAALPPAGPARRNHGRLLAAAAVAVLFIVSVAVIGDGPNGDDRTDLELDEDGNRLPAPEPGTLTPLGPNDGLDSIQLPIEVEPSTGLREGDRVTVTGRGFLPGEQVGIVQCAREAGGETRAQRSGVDACEIGDVVYADADDQGEIEGSFTVRRLVTTSATGTVDCTVEAERCVIGVGALSDYDRSGGYGLTFVGGGEPIDIPTVTVTPTEGLSDGDVVHVEGEGFEPGPVTLSVCSIDPASCWETGDPIHLTVAEVEDLGLVEFYGGEYVGTGLVADSDGRISGDVPVWRFLPGATSGSYVDCAVSRCSLRFYSDLGDLAPEPPRLAFVSGGAAPKPPAVAAEPTRDVEVGDEIVVRGAGFIPGNLFYVNLCASVPGEPENVLACAGDGGDSTIEDDGGFAVIFEVPDLVDGQEAFGPTTTVCATGVECDGDGSLVLDDDTMCDGVTTECWIRVESYSDGMPTGPPTFLPAPIRVTFAR